jgi:leucyl-tRNA synthetase
VQRVGEEDRGARRAARKTGVFTGFHVVNPVNGSGCRVRRRLRADRLRHRRDHGRPGHDERDFAFAQAYDSRARGRASGRRRGGRAAVRLASRRTTCS